VVLERDREGLVRLDPMVIAMLQIGADDVVMLGQLVRDDAAVGHGVLRIAFPDRGRAWEQWVAHLAQSVVEDLAPES
jgi:hypothetical protein